MFFRYNDMTINTDNIICYQLKGKSIYFKSIDADKRDSDIFMDFKTEEDAKYAYSLINCKLNYIKLNKEEI